MILKGTEDVRAHSFEHKGINFVVVDTPGFNDSRSSDDGQVVDRILSWLEVSYKQGTRLNGLIYLHRISDPRMPGTAMRNLSMFRQLCGSNNFSNVILGTTFWGKVNQSIGAQREQQLKTSNEMWGSMVKKGSKVMKVQENRASNLAILEHIAQNNGKVVVEAQKEMSSGKSRLETSAALDVNRMFEEYRKQQQSERELELEKQAEEEERRAQRRRKALADAKIEADRRLRLAQEEERRRREQEEQARQTRLREQKREMERREVERARVQALENQLMEQRRAEALAEAQRRFYAYHVCAGISTYRRHCDMCGVRLHKHRYTYWRMFFPQEISDITN
jgi:hypothetical protein